ncbi:MAG: TauD/TfdA family dioxygenase [Hydrococcus sp. C42_A2020_068]|nr:TauD/TfdA family dioxygenase [Hydrococcus sp. C42_A2020_068]
MYVVMLYGIKITPAGIDRQPHTTEFLDLIQAYNNLERQRQEQLEQMSMYHTAPMFFKTNDAEADVPKKVHPIVSTHEITGKKGLYLGSNTAIPVGMEDRPEQAKQIWGSPALVVISKAY